MSAYPGSLVHHVYFIVVYIIDINVVTTQQTAYH